eukprot:scaffold41840_cov50-Phaeocystis_antarctica.AAC.2
MKLNSEPAAWPSSQSEVERREVARRHGEDGEEEGAQNLAQRDRIQRGGDRAAASGSGSGSASASAAVMNEGSEGPQPGEADGDKVEGDAGAEEGEEEGRYIMVEEGDALDHRKG